VFPQRLFYIGRRFGTLCQVHLQRIKDFTPFNMDLTEVTETSANINQTPGKHPKENTLNTEHGESLE
jgi:hypothetical protein